MPSYPIASRNPSASITKCRSRPSALNQYRSGRSPVPPPLLPHGIHQAFVVLGWTTLLSTIVFRELKKRDGVRLQNL